jgi:hypothetical protein
MYVRPAKNVGDESRVPDDHVVEPHPIGLIRFREQDNLPGVHREVFDDVVHRLEHGHVVRLNDAPRMEVGRGERREDAVDVRDRLFEPIDQRGHRYRRTLVELGLAISHVRRAADAADDPLPRVPGEVQQQVADTVRRLVRSRPDDAVVEHGDGQADLRQIFPEVPARQGDDGHAGVGLGAGWVGAPRVHRVGTPAGSSTS